LKKRLNVDDVVTRGRDGRVDVRARTGAGVERGEVEVLPVHLLLGLEGRHRRRALAAGRLQLGGVRADGKVEAFPGRRAHVEVGLLLAGPRHGARAQVRLRHLARLGVLPVGGHALRHVRVAPHQIAHEVLRVDVRREDVAVLLPRRPPRRHVLQVVVHRLERLAHELPVAPGEFVPEPVALLLLRVAVKRAHVFGLVVLVVVVKE